MSVVRVWDIKASVCNRNAARLAGGYPWQRGYARSEMVSSRRNPSLRRLPIFFLLVFGYMSKLRLPVHILTRYRAPVHPLMPFEGLQRLHDTIGNEKTKQKNTM